jgi:hypothetical protein
MLNPSHPAMKRVKVIDTLPFRFDDRLFHPARTP